MDEEKRLSYFCLGLGLGVAVGILFAPQSGQETRGMLRARAEEGKDFLKRKSEDLRDSAGDIIERGRTAITEQKVKLSEAVRAGQQAYKEAVGGAESSGA